MFHLLLFELLCHFLPREEYLESLFFYILVQFQPSLHEFGLRLRFFLFHFVEEGPFNKLLVIPLPDLRYIVRLLASYFDLPIRLVHFRFQHAYPISQQHAVLLDLRPDLVSFLRGERVLTRNVSFAPLWIIVDLTSFFVYFHVGGVKNGIRASEIVVLSY